MKTSIVKQEPMIHWVMDSGGSNPMRRNRGQYQGSQCRVTSQHFTTPRKGYRLSDISLVNIRRTAFCLLSPLLIGILSLVLFCSELLYSHEIFIALLVVVVLGGVSFSIGMIFLTGFNVSGLATFGLYWQMAQLKNDLDAALENPARSNHRRERYRQ